MPEFTNPFSGIVPQRKLTDSELARALRLDLAAEEEAVHIYEAHADATDNELARKVLRDIADEERVHAGEFQRLLNILLKDEEGFLAEGAEEVNEMAKEGDVEAAGEHTSEAVKSIPTVGDIKQ
jgi:rubrerythrin